MEWHVCIALSLVLLVAAGHDLKTRRVPNWLTFPIMLSGLGYNLVVGGPVGLAFAVLGLLAGFGLTLVPHAMGLMGAGDVKLMAAVGAVLGPAHAFWAFVLASLIGGAYAVVVMALRAGLFTSDIDEVWFKMAALGPRNLTQEEAVSGGRATICYGLALALGTILTMTLAASGLWRAPWTG